MSVEENKNSVLADVIRPGVSRGLDFVSLEELRKRTGVVSSDVLKFAMSEMLCNALDKDASEIKIAVQVDSEFDRLTVADNGTKKLSRFEIELIVDFENKASSKRGFLRVSRGYLGNALKCIFGYSYALAESRNLTPPKITITSGNRQYMLSLKPNRVAGMINTEIIESERNDDGYTAFMLEFPKVDADATANLKKLKDIILATGMVNPTRRILFNLYGEQGTLGTAEERKAIRQETSIEWYTLKQFTELFEDFFRAGPDAQLKAFIAMFRGFTGRKIIREILQELNTANHDSRTTIPLQFFPTSTLKELPPQYVEKLLVIMKAKTKRVGKRSIPAVLGSIDEDNFQKIKEKNHWSKLRYVVLTGVKSSCPKPHWPTCQGNCGNPDHVEYPYLVELAVIDRNDEDGLEVYQCVNFMASTEPVFSSAFDVKYRLGIVRIKAFSSVTIIVHLICPVLPWLNYGKSALANVDSCYLIEKAFDKILPIPKTPREYHPPPPPRPLSWVPHGKVGDQTYEERLKSFAAEIKAIESQRTSSVKYSTRGWCYQLEGLGKIDKGEFDASQKAINDCRKIGLLPIDFVAEDQDTTRHFKGIHNASDPTVLLGQIKDDVAEMLDSLPSNITDYWIGEKHYLMMCVEKGDLLNLFKPICSEYHVPLVSSKGWAPILLRSHMANLSKKAEATGLTPVLLLFYDHDPAGLKITETFRKNLKDCMRGTGWNPTELIIERFGLNKDDIDLLNLTWIGNVQTGSGRESRDEEYLEKYGRRKCEANALFKSDGTLRAAEVICRNAIEKYYGADAKERFKRKEEQAKEKLKEVYDNPIWSSFVEEIGDLINSLHIQPLEADKPDVQHTAEEEFDVSVDNIYNGHCPKCRTSFSYEESDVGKLKRCRCCGVAMRLKWRDSTRTAHAIG